MTPLTLVQTALTRIPHWLRVAIYASYAIAALVLGLLNVLDIDTGRAGDVLAYVGAYVGAQATANATAADVQGRHEAQG